MILLESDLNERCKNKTISEKINIYKESKLNLPKEIDASSFNIQNRTEQIVKIVYKLINELQQ